MGDLNEIQAARAMELDHTQLMKSIKSRDRSKFLYRWKTSGFK